MSNNKKALEALITFLATTPGRDKSCRLVQYSARFFKALCLHLAKQPNQGHLLLLAEKIDALGSTMGMTRKVLRWGRPIGIIRNILVSLKSIDKRNPNQNTWLIYFKIFADISLALFFLFDHVLFLGRLKIVKDDKLISRADYLSNLFWLYECVCAIIADSIQIHITQNKLAQDSLSKQKDSAETVEARNKIDASVLNILRSLVDIPIAIHFINSKFLDPGFVGILGTITSLIGCYQSWPATK